MKNFKNKYLKQLKKQLHHLPADVINHYIIYYSEIISDCEEDGLSEIEITNKIGTPKDIAKTIYKEFPILHKNTSIVINIALIIFQLFLYATYIYTSYHFIDTEAYYNIHEVSIVLAAFLSVLFVDYNFIKNKTHFIELLYFIIILILRIFNFELFASHAMNSVLFIPILSVIILSLIFYQIRNKIKKN